jgi:hypothetical protein
VPRARGERRGRRPAGVESGQCGWTAGEVIVVLTFGGQRRQRDWSGSYDHQRWFADENRVPRRPGRTAELQAQVALRGVMLLNRAVLQAVRNVRRGRKEQRDQCEQDDQPWMAGTHDWGLWTVRGN